MLTTRSCTELLATPLDLPMRAEVVGVGQVVLQFDIKREPTKILNNGPTSRVQKRKTVRILDVKLTHRPHVARVTAEDGSQLRC